MFQEIRLGVGASVINCWSGCHKDLVTIGYNQFGSPQLWFIPNLKQVFLQEGVEDPSPTEAPFRDRYFVFFEVSLEVPFIRGRSIPGRYSLTTPRPMFQPMLIPKLEAASPIELSLGGCQNLER